MRLLYLITRAEPGGAQVHVLELLRAFRGQAEVHLGVGEDRDGFLIEEARKLGVEVHLLRGLVQPIRPHRDLPALLEVGVLLKRLRPHLVHAHSSKAGFLGRLAARGLGVKSVYTAHGWAFTEGVPEGRRRLALAMERFAGRLGDRVSAVSHYDRDLALRHRVVPAERLKVIWNGVPDTPLRARPEAHPRGSSWWPASPSKGPRPPPPGPCGPKGASLDPGPGGGGPPPSPSAGLGPGSRPCGAGALPRGEAGRRRSWRGLRSSPSPPTGKAFPFPSSRPRPLVFPWWLPMWEVYLKWWCPGRRGI